VVSDDLDCAAFAEHEMHTTHTAPLAHLPSRSARSTASLPLAHTHLCRFLTSVASVCARTSLKGMHVPDCACTRQRDVVALKIIPLPLPFLCRAPSATQTAADRTADESEIIRKCLARQAHEVR
jgi:hypothetical protein